MFRIGAEWEDVKAVSLGWPGVEATIKYDGSPVLKVDGVFLAGLAMDASAEPETLVVRCACDDRARLMEDGPETYYVTDYYRRYRVVLVRLSRVGPDALRELLATSLCMAIEKSPKKGRRHQAGK